MNRAVLFFALLALASLAFAGTTGIRVLGCAESTQPFVVVNPVPQGLGGWVCFVCNLVTGTCANSTAGGSYLAGYNSRVITGKILLNGSFAASEPGGANQWLTSAVCDPAFPQNCRLNISFSYPFTGGGTDTILNFSGFGYPFCAAAYLEENHFRDGTTSNFSITPHNLGGLRWSCAWNASANAQNLPGSYTNGTWTNAAWNETQNVTLAIGTDIQNASIQYGQIACTDELGTRLQVYRSGCGYGMGCQASGASWTWAALIPESFRIINPNTGERDSVASIPGVAYAYERVTGMRLRVVDAITYTDNVAVRSFRANFTLPAQCSMAQTLKYLSQYAWTGVAGGMSLDENQVYTLSWADDPIVCTAPANITVEINASESVWPPGVMESDTIAYSPAAVVSVLSPEFTIDNVQAFENYAEGPSSEDPVTNGSSGTYDFWASISHKFTRTPVSDLENVSCIAYFTRGMGMYFGFAAAVADADGSHLWFDVNYSRDTFTGTWNIQCGSTVNGTAGTNGTECVNETVAGNRTNYTNAHGQAMTAYVPSFAIPEGWWFIPAADMSLRAVTQYTGAVDGCANTCTTAHLYGAAHASLANATFAGGVAEFDYPLTSGEWYAVDCDSGGAYYSLCYATSAAYPYVLSNISVVARSENGGNDTTNIGAIKSITISEREYNVTNCVNGTNATNGTSGTFIAAVNVTGTGLLPTERLLRTFSCVREPTERETSDPWVVYYDANYPYSTESGKYVCTVALEGYAFDSAYLYRTPPPVENASGAVSACIKSVLGTTTGTTPCYTFEVANSASYLSLIRSLAFVPSASLVRFTPQDGSFSVARYYAVGITANGTPQYELSSAASLDLMLRARPKVIVHGTEFKVIAKAAGNTGGNLSEFGDALKCSVSATGVIGGQVDASIDIYTIDSLGRVGCRSKGFDKPTLEITYSNVSPAWDTYTWSYIIYGMGTDPSCNSTRMLDYLNRTAGGSIQCDAAVRYVSADGGVRNMPNEPVHLLVAAGAAAQCTGGDCSSIEDKVKNGVAGFVGGILAWSFSSWENFAVTFAIPLGLIICMPFIVAIITSPSSAVVVEWITRKRR